MSINKNKITRVIESRIFWISLLFLIFATEINFLFSDLIQFYYPNRQPIIDTLFNITPYVGWAQYITDLAVLFSPVVLLYNVILKDMDHLPYYMSAFSVGYFLRGLLIFLNPIGGAQGNMEVYGLTTIMQHGMFPSGHTILVFVAYFLSRQICDKGVQFFLLAMCVIEVVSLTLSRGHYTIDIIGGILISYFVINEITKKKAFLRLSPVIDS